MAVVAPPERFVKAEVRAPSPNADVSSSQQAAAAARQALDDLIAEVVRRAEAMEPFYCFEAYLLRAMLELGRLLVLLFLWRAHEHLEVPWQARRGQARYERQAPKHRSLRTLFGEVRYGRYYLHKKNGQGGGYFPLDESLGLTADGFSFGVLSWASQLATKMSYAAAAATFKHFLGWAPSTKSIEKAVLGLGAYAETFLTEQPPPKNDGEVLVVQIDAKGIPTATAEEMSKRRGKRAARAPSASPRHRGRDKRRRLGPKRRRKAGDKSKNARLVHLIVLYTLRRGQDADGEPVLLGPLNKRVYACTGGKRKAVAKARELADGRGFSTDSGKRVQILTDGDEIYAEEIARLFPEPCLHTLDVVHAIEYLWQAGHLLDPSDATARAQWVAERRGELCAGDVDAVLTAMRTRLGELDDSEPAEAKARRRTTRRRKRETPRQKLRDIVGYLEKRRHMMRYDQLAEEDLEWATGIVEGAVRYVLGQRFDEGGMRWLRKRSAALVHLRCMEVNGCWDDFARHVHDRLHARSRRSKSPPRLLTNTPPPLCPQPHA